MFSPGYAKWCAGTLMASTSSFGAGAELSYNNAEVPDHGSQPPHFGPPEETAGSASGRKGGVVTATGQPSTARANCKTAIAAKTIAPIRA
jgi:hypothetical protein